MLDVVAALAISCFLYALSLNILVEAIKRFFYVEPLQDPQLIVIVGGHGNFFMTSMEAILVVLIACVAEPEPHGAASF
jgi:Co/Zn/Cd efflux system component